MIRRPLLLLICIFGSVILGSARVHTRSDVDNTYYKSNNKGVSLGLLTSVRDYKVTIQQNFNDDPQGISSVAWQADARTATGFSIDYGKIALNIAFRTGITEPEKKGITDYRNVALSFGGNKFLSEASYRDYSGFYDNNTSKYTQPFSGATPYYQDANMHAQLVKLKLMYFPGHRKFSYKAAYSSGYRQLKSALSTIVAGSVHYEKLQTTTSLIPEPIREYYGPGADSICKLNTYALSGGFGITGTLVIFKRLFLNVTVLPYIELQKRDYGWSDDNKSKKALELALSGDLRGSIGYSTDRFFILLYTLNDIRNMNAKGLQIQSVFTSGTLNIGYRFDIAHLGAVKKVTNSKLYQKL